jgi:hypothetical protein
MNSAPSVISTLDAELERCRRDPARFFEKWLGVTTLYDKQVEILESIRDNRRTAVQACHASGKTFLVGGAVWWIELCFPPAITVSTAPTDRQVRELLWGEIRAHYGRAPVGLPGEPGIQSWRMPDPPGETGRNAKWYATGFSTRPDQVEEHASRFTGYHSKTVFVVFDEASGIMRQIWKAAEGLLSAGHFVRLIAIGNPLDPVSAFADATRSPLFNSVRISAFDTPNLRADLDDNAFLVTPEWVEEQKLLEGTDSPLYIAKVLGLFPEGGEDTLIPLRWISAALERDPHEEKGEGIISLGCDVARFGTDATAIYVVRGQEIIFAEAYYGKRTPWTAKRILEVAEEVGIHQSQAFRISVDDTGVGGGVTDRLHEFGWVVTDVDFGRNASDEDHFADIRTEIWWNLRNWMEHAELGRAPYRARARLEGDLSTPKYDFDGKGRRILEPKKHMKKRLGRSPDDGDALALALAYQVAKPTAWPAEMDDPEKDLEDDDELPTGTVDEWGKPTHDVLERFFTDRPLRPLDER